MKASFRSWGAGIVFFTSAFPSASYALTASQQYALASAAAVNTIWSTATPNSVPDGVPLCNPPGCNFPQPATPDVASQATALMNASGVTVDFGGCSLSNGSGCDANYKYNPSNGTGYVNVDPSVSDSALSNVLLHEDIHHLTAKYDGPMNFDIFNIPTNTSTYGTNFGASEALAYSTAAAAFSDSVLFAAQYHPGDVASMIADYRAGQQAFQGTYTATNEGLNLISTSLNATGVAGQLLNNAPLSGQSSSFATLPNGNILQLSSFSDSGRTAIAVLDPNYNTIGGLSFQLNVDMTTAAGRSQAINYITSKLSAAQQVQGMLDPSLQLNQQINTINEQAITLAQQIAANPPALPAPTCNVSCKMQYTDNLIHTSTPSVVIGTLASNSTTAYNNAKTIVAPKPSPTPSPSPTKAPVAGASCSFNGRTIASGSSVTAYSLKIAYRSCGDSCSANSEVRTCSNGVLSGSFTLTSCTYNTTSLCP